MACAGLTEGFAGCLNVVMRRFDQVDLLEVVQQQMLRNAAYSSSTICTLILRELHVIWGIACHHGAV